MIKGVKVGEGRGNVASVMVRKGRKGAHEVEIWTPKCQVIYEINKRDLPVGKRKKEDIMEAAIALFKENYPELGGYSNASRK